MDGWIKLYRKTLDSAVFDDPFLYRLWTLCLLKATYKPRDVVLGNQVVHLEVGEFITGRESLAGEFNQRMKKSQRVSQSTLWRWLWTLERLGNLNIKSNNKFSVVSVVNYAVYNSQAVEDEQQLEQQMDNRWTADEQQMDTNKKLRNKELKEVKEVNKNKTSFAEHVRMTQEEHDKLVEKFGQDETNAYINRLDNYIGSKGRRYKSHYRTILVWADKDRRQTTPSKGGNANVSTANSRNEHKVRSGTSNEEGWARAESNFFS